MNKNDIYSVEQLYKDIDSENEKLAKELKSLLTESLLKNKEEQKKCWEIWNKNYSHRRCYHYFQRFCNQNWFDFNDSIHYWSGVSLNDIYGRRLFKQYDTSDMILKNLVKFQVLYCKIEHNEYDKNLTAIIAINTVFKYCLHGMIGTNKIITQEEVNNLENIFWGSQDIINIIQSVTEEIDTGNITVYDCHKKMLYPMKDKPLHNLLEKWEFKLDADWIKGIIGDETNYCKAWHKIMDETGFSKQKAIYYLWKFGFSEILEKRPYNKKCPEKYDVEKINDNCGTYCNRGGYKPSSDEDFEWSNK